MCVYVYTCKPHIHVNLRCMYIHVYTSKPMYIHLNPCVYMYIHVNLKFYKCALNQKKSKKKNLKEENFLD